MGNVVSHQKLNPVEVGIVLAPRTNASQVQEAVKLVALPHPHGERLVQNVVPIIKDAHPHVHVLSHARMVAQCRSQTHTCPALGRKLLRGEPNAVRFSVHL